MVKTHLPIVQDLANINVDNSIRKWLNVNSTIKEIIIGDEVTTIGDHAFGGWNKIEKIDIGQSVKSIGERAFAGSDNLSEVICRAVTVPETNKSTFENSYPDYAFLYYRQIQSHCTMEYL